MKVTAAYPGREGAHSAAAAERLFPDGVEHVPVASFSAVIEAAVSGQTTHGVLPIESSLSGPVAETHDLLYRAPLSITGEAILPIRHCLVGLEEVPLDRIQVVHSHPAALDQCRSLLAAMPWATAVAAATTADAAAHVAARADRAHAAIASERAARLHGLTVIAGDVGDHPEAYTRFVAVSTHTRLDRSEQAWRTAFSFVTDHRPGALHRALEPFRSHEVDLAQLVSRPIPEAPWSYRFDAVLTGHPLDEDVRKAFAELRNRTRELKIFGSYPSAR